MKEAHGKNCQQMFTALRKIVQAMDQHSSFLQKEFGVTASQLFILQAIFNMSANTISEVAKQVCLSQATVTNITIRLERRGYLIKQNCHGDKRRKTLHVTNKGKQLLNSAPPFFKANFSLEFNDLGGWERLSILSAFERVASMMSQKGPSPSG